MAEEESLMSLFESNWFGHTKSPSQSHHQTVQEKEAQVLSDHDLSFSVPQNLKVRSMSEQLLEPKLGSFSSSETSLSPSSVLANRKLQTIFSGKEASDIHDDQENERERDQEVAAKIESKKESERRMRKRRKERRASKLGGVTSKSLSELEFEELKGFMDLGFVFTEEEFKDSKLVSMIPGLQRLCKTCISTDLDQQHHRSEDHDHQHHNDHHVHLGNEGVISRPYLSEAWDVLEENERKKSAKPLVIDWKVTALGNDIHMKDQLKFWAHTVASTVR